MLLTTGSTAARLRVFIMILGLVALVATPLTSAGAVGDQQPQPSFEDYGFQGEGHARVQNLDARDGTVAPTSQQRSIARALGAKVRFNAFGTPHVLINHQGALTGPRSGEAVDVARSFVRDNASLFRLDVAKVDALEVLNDTPLYDAPDLGRVRDGLEPRNSDVAHVVLFRQRFGDLEAGLGGLLTVGVQRDGSVVWASSSVTGDGAVSGTQKLDAAAAIRAAAADVDLAVGELTEVATPDDDFITFESELAADVQRARQVALPTPADGVRLAWEVTLLNSDLDEHGNPTAFITFVDAESGKIWHRSNQVEHLADGLSSGALAQADDPDDDDGTVRLPEWKVFPANPPFVTDDNTADDSQDTRQLWCWDNRTNKKCDEQQRNTASRFPWDVNPSSAPSFSTDGNNASTAISEVSPFTPDTAVQRPIDEERTYNYSWDNRWFKEKCDPTNFGPTDSFVTGGPNDEAAAVTNLFVMHNRMHDWSYFLGFTETTFNLQKTNFGNTGPERENDPEVGQAQGGRRTPIFGRDNANQITLQDGIAPITNQYLWQPLAGAFYSPCVDGAYDMAVVAHEYGHAISNRMIGGPDNGTGGSQGQTESWSDLIFAAYFTEFDISSGDGVNRYTLGPYVTGDDASAIRNYAMNHSPLNYSDLEYDGSGLTSPHANGEIWSAVNFDILEALNVKYNDRFPSRNSTRQRLCARGKLITTECPGNRRWNQIQFDSFLLTPVDSTMVDSRDAMLAADKMRFDGENQKLLWNVFARRGLGGAAKSKPIDDGNLVSPRDRDDFDPRPGWGSPLRDDEAVVTFKGVDSSGKAHNTEFFVGDYEARVTPVADTRPGTEKIDDVERFLPGRYEMLARAKGFGVRPFTVDLGANDRRVVRVELARNLASKFNGANAFGDGVNHDRLLDDTEATNWASREPGGEGTASEGKGEGRQVEGRQVTVNLAGGAHIVKRLRISAALNAGCNSTRFIGNCPREEQDTGTQNRFSALRSFNIRVCDASTGVDCKKDRNYERIYRSPDDAFPGSRPRPKVPNLILRPFDVRDTRATHVRMVVRDNQCTGGPDFQGDVNEDNDPENTPDCDTPRADTAERLVLNPPEDLVRAAELQVYGAAAPRLRDPQPDAEQNTAADAPTQGGSGSDERDDNEVADARDARRLPRETAEEAEETVGETVGENLGDVAGVDDDRSPTLAATDTDAATSVPAADRTLAATGFALDLPAAVAAGLLLLVVGALLLVVQRRQLG